MISRKFLFAVCVVMVLGGCVSPRELLGWAKDEPFVLTDLDKQQFATSSPVFSKGLGQVNFDMGHLCLGCGDFSDTNGIGIDHIEWRLKYGFPALLRQELARTTLFTPGDNSLSIRAKLTDISQQSSVGGQAERKSPLTSGAVLISKVSVQYDLLDKEQVVGSWLVTTSARSNSLAASTRLTENIDGALKRNLRAFLLHIVADYSRNDAARANSALVSLQSEVDNKRIALAYLIYGATKTVTTTAGVVGDGLTVVAQNSGAISDGLKATSASMERSNREHNDAYTKALLAGRDQTVGPSDGVTTTSRDNSVSRRDSVKPTGSLAKSATSSSATTTANDPSGTAGRERVAHSEDSAQKQRTEQSQKDAHERIRKEADAKALAEQQRKEQVAKQEQERQRLVKEKAAREEKEKADKLAAKKAEEDAKRNYLSAMIKGIRLRATKCLDGEGKYYATGTQPKIKPEVVGCLDVQYRAYCPGSVQYSEGVAHNFVGMSGCYGDTYDINPKPNCKVEEVRIEVVDARGCP